MYIVKHYYQMYNFSRILCCIFDVHMRMAYNTISIATFDVHMYSCFCHFQCLQMLENCNKESCDQQLTVHLPNCANDNVISMGKLQEVCVFILMVFLLFTFAGAILYVWNVTNVGFIADQVLDKKTSTTQMMLIKNVSFHHIFCCFSMFMFYLVGVHNVQRKEL